jgi:hypothetical protein
MKQMRITVFIAIISIIFSACASGQPPVATTEPPVPTEPTAVASSPEKTVPAETTPEIAQGATTDETPDADDNTAVAEADLRVKQAATVIAEMEFGGVYHYGDTPTNEYAVFYLFGLANRFYLDRADSYEITSGFSKYMAFPQEEIEEILNFAFGDRFSTADLLTDTSDNPLIVYNAKAYYIALGDPAEPIELSLVQKDSDYSYVYTVAVTDFEGIKSSDFELTVILQPSDKNQYGVSIASVIVMA